MRILIGKTVLFEGKLSGPEDGWRVRSVDEVQEIEGLRADYKQVVNRGNTVNVLTLQATRDHGDNRTAEIFALTHKSTLPVSGDITLICESQTGAQTTLTLSDGTIHDVEIEQHGNCTISRYTMSGGEISTYP
jgi:hypothetical protein